MQIIINVDDKYAEKVRAFKAAIEAPVAAHKGIPSVTIVAKNGPAVNELIVRGLNIEFDGVPEPDPIVGDLVCWSEKNWSGTVISVTATKVNVKASKQTLTRMQAAGSTKDNFWAPASQLEIL